MDMNQKFIDAKNAGKKDKDESGTLNPAFNEHDSSFSNDDVGVESVNMGTPEEEIVVSETVNPVFDDNISLSSQHRIQNHSNIEESSHSSSLTCKTTSTIIDIDEPLTRQRNRKKHRRRPSSLSKRSKRTPSPSPSSSVSVSIKAKVIDDSDDDVADKKSIKLTVEANGVDIDPADIKVDLDDVKDVLEKQTAKNSEDMARANTIVAKKAVTSGLLDLALLSANIFQFRIVLALGPSKVTYYEFALWLIVSSASLQIFTAIFLMVSGKKDTERKSGKKHAHLNRCLDFLNSLTTLTVFAVTVLNVIITAFAFGLDYMVNCELPEKQTDSINQSKNVNSTA
ncbi:uncharacterized protein LOC141910145 [Tubulanus polymorphus]|uniref:uncharacterized protein LOC141910145 n=1 Tax=Tubulanus polymorphus TaxID=672921 RepID=UPI003DA452F0